MEAGLFHRDVDAFGTVLGALLMARPHLLHESLSKSVESSCDEAV